LTGTGPGVPSKVERRDNLWGDYELPGRLMNDAAHWRARAEEARVHAEQICDPEARRMMLEIAAGYERIAERAEQRLCKKGEASDAS